MKTKTTVFPQNGISLMCFESMINMGHEMVLLSEKINWKGFEKKLVEFYIQNIECQGLPI